MASALDTLDLSLSRCADLDELLLKVWKITKEDLVSCKYSSSDRINNRSWRLLNSKILNKDQDLKDTSFQSMLGGLAKDSLSHLKPKHSQFLSNRVLTNSHSTLFSHSSRLSLNERSRSSYECDNDDLSEDISEIEEEDDDLISSDEADVPTTDNEKISLRIRTVERTPTPESEDKDHKDTLFVKGFSPKEPKGELPVITKSTTNQSNKGIFYIGNPPSPQETEPKESSRLSVTGITRQDSLFGSGLNQRSCFGEDDFDNSSTDISEEDEGEEPQNYVQDKDSRGNEDIEDERKSRDDESEWLSVSSSDGESPKVRSNPIKFDKKRPFVPGSYLESPLTINGHSSNSFDRPRSLLSNLFLHQLNVDVKEKQIKPLLKRSSTTGIITIDQERRGTGRSNAKRTSILFSKCNSLSNISSNFEPDEKEDMLVAKQKSLVGVSDFNVVTRPTENVEINDREKLSLSLNKYSSTSSISFKNILSKSSLSLSGLIGATGTKLRKPLEKAKREREKENIAVSPTSRGGDDLNEDLSANLTPNLIKVNPNANVKANLANPNAHTNSNSKINSNSDLNSEINTYAKDPSPRSSIPLSGLSPKSTRRSMLSTELSQSLKDSIIIDYKLGKIPVPAKVVRAAAEGEVGMGDDDDYHSKGW